MYTSKQFKARKEEDVFKDIDAFSPYKAQIRKVFLADGDPMVLSTPRLLRILEKLKATFPNLQRVSTYATPDNIINKSTQELMELKSAGLDLLYVGIESGDDKVLDCLQKGETFKSIVEGVNKAKLCEIDSSVMIINGAGGQLLSKQHAINSAKVLNETQPKYASTLVLTTYKGLDHFKKRFVGNYIPLSTQELAIEMRTFIANLELKETIFRSDHASNFLILKGILGKDKEVFMSQLDSVITNPDFISYRQNFKSGI